MRESGGEGPQGVADRRGAPQGGQARRPGLPGASRGAYAVGAAALAGWSLLAVGGGGIDPGDGLGGPGPRAAFVALALGAPLAGLALLMAWNRVALRALPSRLALAGAAGLAAWSACSMLWAAAPDLAWIDANRQAVALCALVVGLCLGALLPGAPGMLGLGLSAGAMLPMGLALATKALPAVLGQDSDLARIAAPVGYWNGLALIAVIAVPGLLWLAGGAGGIRGATPIAAVGLTVALTTLLLTYSRGGILALAMVVVVTIAFLPRRAPALAALGAGAIAAALPTAHALTDPLLSADQIPTAVREQAAAGLAWRILAALAIAAVLAPGLALLAGRITLDRRRARRLAAALAVGVVVAGVAGFLVSEPARDWGGDRLAEFRGEGGDAVANDPGRLVNAAGNQRKGWWGEAWRGFTAQPVIGQGAGGFSLIHLQERRSGDDDLSTREAHGVLPSIASGTGLIGLGLFLVLVGGVVWAVVRAGVRHAAPDIGVPFAVLAAFTLQASVDWSWQIPALTVPAFAAAGVVLAAAAPGGREGRPGRPGPVAAGAIAGACLLAVASAALPWWSSHRTSAGEESLAEGRPAAARDHAEGARAANPLTIAPLLLLGRAHTDLGEPARALGAYQEATRLQPDNPAAWRALAIFLGRDPSAVDAWREVRRLDPQDPEAALRAG